MHAEIPPWMVELKDEDWQFIKRFLLASGSLKDLALQYGISYPTVRLRLDRLIEKIRVLDNPKAKSSFHRKIQLLVAENRLDLATAKSLMRAHEESLKEEGTSHE
ncbi:MAG TPA: DUF2089 family protein [Candidatus Sumerlaeota bacterium]|nr:DUF2089 family protein [Candidatus Sumerlaeota bacterium]HPS02736.1 DUF2089 family protein [Candidatus Sumerlaeota bacterium]